MLPRHHCYARLRALRSNSLPLHARHLLATTESSLTNAGVTRDKLSNTYRSALRNNAD